MKDEPYMESEYIQVLRRRKAIQLAKKRRKIRIIQFGIAFVSIAALFIGIYTVCRYIFTSKPASGVQSQSISNAASNNSAKSISSINADGNKEGEEISALDASPLNTEVPDWVTQDILPVNEYSRPGDKLDAVNGVVVHYIGNAGTTAEQNRSYFNNLATSGETSASSHFIIGIDGTIVQAVPLDEITYCSNNRNNDTISIECCHEDDSGEFTQETEDSLVKLTKWLCETYNLSRDQILRHYDITGKVCPLNYVEDESKWETFLDKVKG